MAHLKAATSLVKLGNAAQQARVPTTGTRGERVTSVLPGSRSCVMEVPIAGSLVQTLSLYHQLMAMCLV